MKLAIISCLVVLAAVCHASNNQDAIDMIKRLLSAKAPSKNGFKNVNVLKSAELMQKMRNLKAEKTKKLAHKKLTTLCQNAHVELENRPSDGAVEEGLVLYPKELASLLSPAKRAHRPCQDVTCDFQLAVEEDQLVFIYVNMWPLGADVPACGLDGAGQLALYAGTSIEGQFLGSACGGFEQAFIAPANELHFTFTEDPTTPIGFLVYYEIITQENILASVDREDLTTAAPVADAGAAGAADPVAADPVAADPVAANPAAADPAAADPAANAATADLAAALRRALARLGASAGRGGKRGKVEADQY